MKESSKTQLSFLIVGLLAASVTLYDVVRTRDTPNVIKTKTSYVNVVMPGEVVNTYTEQGFYKGFFRYSNPVRYVVVELEDGSIIGANLNIYDFTTITSDYVYYNNMVTNVVIKRTYEDVYKGDELMWRELIGQELTGFDSFEKVD